MGSIHEAGLATVGPAQPGDAKEMVMKLWVAGLAALCLAGCSVVMTKTSIEVEGGSTATVRVDPDEIRSSARHEVQAEAVVPAEAVPEGAVGEAPDG